MLPVTAAAYYKRKTDPDELPPELEVALSEFHANGGSIRTYYTTPLFYGRAGAERRSRHRGRHRRPLSVARPSGSADAARRKSTGTQHRSAAGTRRAAAERRVRSGLALDRPARTGDRAGARSSRLGDDGQHHHRAGAETSIPGGPSTVGARRSGRHHGGAHAAGTRAPRACRGNKSFTRRPTTCASIRKPESATVRRGSTTRPLASGWSRGFACGLRRRQPAPRAGNAVQHRAGRAVASDALKPARSPGPARSNTCASLWSGVNADRDRAAGHLLEPDHRRKQRRRRPGIPAAGDVGRARDLRARSRGGRPLGSVAAASTISQRSTPTPTRESTSTPHAMRARFSSTRSPGRCSSATASAAGFRLRDIASGRASFAPEEESPATFPRGRSRPSPPRR